MTPEHLNAPVNLPELSPLAMKAIEAQAEITTVPPRVPLWNWRDVFLFFGLALPCILLVEMLAAFVARFFQVPVTNALVAVIGQMFAYAVLFALLAGMLRLQYDAPFWPTLGWVPSRFPAASSLLAGILLAFGIALLGGLIHLPSVDSPLKKLFDSPHGAVVLGLFGVLVAPLAEELIFRGFLQPLAIRSTGAVAGILLTSFAFGMLHFQENGGSWPHVALLTLAGAAFGTLRYVSRSVRSSVLAHAAYNGTLFIGLFTIGRNAKV